MNTRSHRRNISAQAFAASAALLAAAFFSTATGAQIHDPAPTESSKNLEVISATDYFRSLGWDYSTGTWTGTVTWNPMNSKTPIVLTQEMRDQALGAGAAVAVLDGRANDEHSDLPFTTDLDADPGTQSVVFEFTGFPFNPSYTLPDLHGTHTSGIVGARLNNTGTSGVAPMARLLNYAVFDDNGWVGADEDAVLTHAISFGASVANMSYGPAAAGDFASPASLKAINNHKNSIVVVKSAGNNGVDLVNELLKGKDSNPLTNLIVVGSVDMSIDEDGAITPSIAWYSNTPGSACIALRSGCVVSIMDIFMVAPGGSAIVNAEGTAILEDNDGYINGIWSTDETGGYYRISGTSMAAPHVAGAVALLHSQWPVLKNDPKVTRDILFETATDLGAEGVDPVYGQGLLNVAAAMSPLGVPDFGLTSGSGGGTDDGGGGKGRSKPKKNSKSSTWSLSSTSMVVKHGFAALAEARTSISVFDKYRRDFPVALASLVTEGRSDLSRRLEVMVGAGRSWADQEVYVPGRDDFHRALTMDHRDLRGDPALSFMSDLRLETFDEIDVRLFAGSGSALPIFYTPAVLVGGMSTLSGTNSGINPVLGFAAGEEFAGGSADKIGPFRFAAGLSRKKVSEPLWGDYKAGAGAASLSVALDKTRQVTIVLTELRETGGAFGSRSTGALSLGEETQTRAMTLSWDDTNWNGFAFSASWTLGLSNGDSNGLLTLDDETTSTSFHLGIARSGLIDDRDTLAISLSQPLRIASGSVHLLADKAYDENGVMQMQSETISLTPSGRELDIQIEYRLAAGRSGVFSTFAYHAIDAGHFAGREESGAGLKYRIRF
jgi:subtilisin family serine protease